MSGFVSYALMTHPDRTEGARRVSLQLDRTVDIHIDGRNAGPWATARKAWESTTRTSTWRVLLQDDIDLAPGFADQLEWLLVSRGNFVGRRPMMLYNGLKDQPAPGEHWIERRDGLQGPAIALPSADVFNMLAWVEEHFRDDSTLRSSDIRPALWLESRGGTCLCPSPSWVQHRGWEPSLNGSKSTRSQPRTAPTWDGRPLAERDWLAGLARPTVVAGNPKGASARARWHLWRTGETEPDHVLERAHR